MAILESASADRIAEHFVSYLFTDYTGSNHVRRVAAWAGFVIKGIERAVGSTWWIGGGSENRQLWFSLGERKFKVKYDHTLRRSASRIGGIQVVEVGDGRGNPEISTIATIRDLDEAEEFYNRAPTLFRQP